MTHGQNHLLLTMPSQISPLIIAAELTTVSDWIPTQATDSQALTIKVNQKAKEITAGYEVDDQTMQIAIKLPLSYPLHQATVEGINRVGVDEKRWRSWLINTQGVITFSVSAVPFSSPSSSSSLCLPDGCDL